MNRYPIRVAGRPGSYMRMMLGDGAAGPDRGVSREQVAAQTLAIRNATRARIAAGPVEAVAPVAPAARVDWDELIRSVTEIN